MLRNKFSQNQSLKSKLMIYYRSNTLYPYDLFVIFLVPCLYRFDRFGCTIEANYFDFFSKPKKENSYKLRPVY